MSLAALGIFCAALALTAASPGPSIAALVSRVMACGWRDVMPFLLAMWIGEVLWLSMAIAGLSAIAMTFHLGFAILKYAGVAYLAYLAWRMWTAPATLTPDTGLATPTGQNPLRMFLAGLALTLGNPKIMLFYLALLPTLIDLSAIGAAQWGLLVIATLITCAAIDLVYVLLAVRARLLLRSPRAVRTANRLSALTLGGAAGAIATR